MSQRKKAPPSADPALDPEALLIRLEEAESTLAAIRDGHVEALVVSTETGPKVYALEGADHRYRRLVETMSEGAVLVSSSGLVVYANAAFARMLSAELESVIGRAFSDFVAPHQRATLSELLERARHQAVSGELSFLTRTGGELPAYLSITRNNPGEGEGASVIVTDLTAQKRNEQIVASERLASTILEQSAEPIVVCNLEGIVIRASDAARAIVREGVLGRSFFRAFPLEITNSTTEHPVRAALRGETTSSLELTLARPGESELSFLCTAAPLFDGANILGCVVSLVDISARKRAEAERASLLDAERAARALAEHARLEAEASSRAKDEFLATVSHELRTPLNSMLGWSQLLSSNALGGEKLGHAIEVIRRNVLAQARLVEDLLDVSRIISGQMRLDVQPMEPIRVVSAALESAKPALEAKRIELESALDEAAGQILGDASRVQQIVWNLLSNATKFTPEHGTIRVAVRRTGSAVEIVVADTGQGIPAEFLPFVFERFRQADGSFARRHGGLGLGLAIARHLVELHGGTIGVESPGHGRGSTFTVCLPSVGRKVAPAPRPSFANAHINPNPAPIQVPELRGVRVLVVDDDDDSRDLVVRILEKCEAITVPASSGEQALSLIQESVPDVLVSDIGMPGMDGYELMRTIRALPNERAQRVPALAVTAYARNEDKRRALAEGFQLYFAKPIEPAALASAIARLSRGAAVETTGT